MAYETGVATDHLDLWAKIRTFLTANPDLVAAGQNWTVAWEAGIGAPNESDVVFKGPGMAGTDEILVGLRRVDAPLVNSYQFRMVGMTGVLDAVDQFDLHVNVSTHVGMYVHQNAMKYWFVANGRRFVIVVKVSTTYQALYGGLILPYADPVAYRYPMFIGGSTGPNYGSSYNWTTESAGHTHFVMPYGSGTSSPANIPGAYFLDPSAQWIEFDNGDRESSVPANFIAPWKWGNGLDTNITAVRQVSYYSQFDKTTECLGGGFVLTPATLAQNSPVDQCYGVLDGVFHVPGEGNMTENIVTVDGVDHLVVQNVYRTSQSSFWALALE